MWHCFEAPIRPVRAHSKGAVTAGLLAITIISLVWPELEKVTLIAGLMVNLVWVWS